MQNFILESYLPKFPSDRSPKPWLHWLYQYVLSVIWKVYSSVYFLVLERNLVVSQECCVTGLPDRPEEQLSLYIIGYVHTLYNDRGGVFKLVPPSQSLHWLWWLRRNWIYLAFIFVQTWLLWRKLKGLGECAREREDQQALEVGDYYARD